MIGPIIILGESHRKVFHCGGKKIDVNRNAMIIIVIVALWKLQKKNYNNSIEADQPRGISRFKGIEMPPFTAYSNELV